jgi:hypothetical protein
MHIDYIRVYQPKGQLNYGCDPEGYPTNNYINQYIEAYTNPNLTVSFPNCFSSVDSLKTDLIVSFLSFLLVLGEGLRTTLAQESLGRHVLNC